MGFYGNITNTSNTTFSFDRIYPNRLAMDANANNDGIFIGRYVLVEYDQDAAYPIIYVNNGEFYSSPRYEKTTRIKFEKGTRPANQSQSADVFYSGEIGQVQDLEYDNKGNLIKVNSITFYQCSNGANDNVEYAEFVEFTKTTSTNTYIQNFAIDEKQYGSITFKGYDSTVWVKTTETSGNNLITKYVNIADLNSVVPTFDIAADAPTMEPIIPHFDADSTNVYYKLHAQTPYGFRVKAETNENLSDEKTKHYEVSYSKDTNITTSTPQELDAAIYYNKDAFRAKPYVDQNTGEIIPVVKRDETTTNEIKILPSGYSNNYANKYSHKPISENPDLVGDIQEFSLHLPAIGNMMSDAWDIIHGPNRDDAQTDINSSLQGRLDSFKAMEKNAIPIKRNTDGTFIGSRINGNNFREVTDNAILKENLSISFDEDDAWIRTEINTIGLDNKNKLSGISIHHTFHEDNTNYDFSTNKNIDDIESENESDKIKLYTPKVDAAGHVVGKSIETITLPYGYKTFTTEGLAPLDNEGGEIVEDLYTTINNQDNGNNTSSSSASASISVANNTQDTIAIEPYNKWIQTQLTDDKLIIAHEIHAINTEKSSTDLNDLKDNKIQNEINIPDWDYDEAGHIKKKGEHTYTLPYGYKTIKVANMSDGIAAPENVIIEAGQRADQTQDTLNLNASNKWIVLDNNTEDTIKFGHKLSPLGAKEYKSTDTTITGFGDSFNILKFTTDEAGHIVATGEDTIRIPKGSLNDLTATSSSVLTGISMIDETGVITQTNNDVGKLALTGYVQGSDKTDIGNGDTINSAFAKLQNQITYEENRINTILTGENDLTGTLDTFIELQSYINEHGQEAADMAKAIEDEIARAKTAEEANQKAISDEAIRADLAEKALGTRIDNLDYEKTRVNNYYISSIKQTDGLVEVGTTLLPIHTVTSGTTNGTILVNGSAINVGGLKSAAYTDSSDYARADVLDTEFTYGDDKKTIQDLMNIVKTQADIIVDLTARIEALEPETETPVESE